MNTHDDLHPADQVRVDRIARTLGAGQCDHGSAPNECRVCLELEHAERTSLEVRSSYAFGDWPPCADPGCHRPGSHVHHGAGDEPSTEAPPLVRRPFTGRAYGLRARLEQRRAAS